MEDRNASPVAPRQSVFTRTHALVGIGAVTMLALGWVFLHDPHAKPEDKGEVLRVAPVARYEPAPPPKQMILPVSLPMPITLPPPAVTPPPREVVVPTNVQDPMKTARHAPLLAFGGGGAGGGSGQQGQQGGVSLGAAQPGRPPTELAAKLVPTQVTSVTASVLKNQPYLLTRGTQIQCVLLTAIDSTLPGPISCKLPYDVIGKTGLTLLDRGSIVVGETGGTMNQGQSRLFALWSRAETPQGVVISLDSPGADPLGRAGFEGDVDSHFLARIGNALLLSVVQGGMQVAASAVSAQGSTQLNLGGSESAVAEALRGSVNIRPTLRMNQGDTVSISVIRDLDFSPVYQLSVQ